MSEEKQNIFQREIKFGKAFSDKAKESFYNELGSLLESGIDIQRSLNLLTEEQTNKRVKAILTELESDLVSGSSLSESMSTKSSHFSSYEFQSIKIGEETGRLKIVLRQLAIFFEDKVSSMDWENKALENKRKILSGLMSPGSPLPEDLSPILNNIPHI